MSTSFSADVLPRVRRHSREYDMIVPARPQLGPARPAIVCLQLATLPQDNESAKQLGNHYHVVPAFNNVEEGSLEMTILYTPGL